MMSNTTSSAEPNNPTLNIKVEKYPDNKSAMTLHVNTRVGEDAHPPTFFFPLREKSNAYAEKLGKLGSEILAEINKVEGVIEVRIKPYEITIRKAEMFDWTNINMQVQKIIEDAVAKHRK